MNNSYSHKIEDKDVEVFRALSKITSEDVKEVMQPLSSGKIRMPKIGKLTIENRFIPDLKETSLMAHEGEYVFYAVEKFRFSFFEKAQKRIFIWIPITNEVYTLPFEFVHFEEPKGEVKQTWLIFEGGEEKPVCSQNYGGKKHICSFEKKQLLREFSIKSKEMICTADILKQYFHWSDPDPWVSEHFSLTDKRDPMFYLRHELEETPGWSVRIHYPSRPPMFGWEIDE